MSEDTNNGKAGSGKKKDEYSVWRVGKEHFRHESDILELPEGWCVVESGDAALTRRIKAQSEYWVILGMYKNKVTKQGVCAPSAIVDKIRTDLEAERADPNYQKKLESGRRYRAAKQEEYVEDFEQEVMKFLNFHPRWTALAQKLAHAVTVHATPVGSGTVARTQRIPVEERAEAAVIAWMRHQTSAYDQMYIPNIAGQRKNVRHMIAARSRAILDEYRSGKDICLENCPLATALDYTE